jgi:hypothetical protein
MFKGFTEKLRTHLEEFNRTSDQFLFNISDLEYSSDRQRGEYKFDIISDELRQKLGNAIIANGGTISNPRGINFRKFPYRLESEGTKNYKS